MRILYYSVLKNKELGTAGVHIVEVLNNLAKIGHSIICADGQSYHSIEELILKSSSGKCQSSSWERMKTFIVTSHLQSEIFIIWTLWKELELFSSSLITALRYDPELIYTRRTFFNTAYILSRLLGIPLVNEENGIIIDEKKIQNFGNRFLLEIVDKIEKFSLPRADKIIVVAAKMKEILQNDYNVPEEKIFIIENGANIDLFKPMDAMQARQTLEFDLNSNYICYVGSLVQWQGVEHIINAMPHILDKCIDTQLLIIGDGQLKLELAELAKRIGVSDNVMFVGSAPHNRIPLYINASDICVVPKKPMRTGYSPLKLCEYMACERAVIATKTSGFEILEDNNAGILVNPENSQEFASASIQLLRSPELRTKMGRNGRRFVVENRSWESVAKSVADVCENAIQELKQKR